MPLLDPDPLTDRIKELFRGESADPNAARDPGWLRWAKFFSIIVTVAVVMGGLFVIAPHVAAFWGAWKNAPYGSHSEPFQAVAARDTVHAAWLRFVIGSCIGGSFGMAYAIRCLIKRLDP